VQAIAVWALGRHVVAWLHLVAFAAFVGGSKVVARAEATLKGISAGSLDVSVVMTLVTVYDGGGVLPVGGDVIMRAKDKDGPLLNKIDLGFLCLKGDKDCAHLDSMIIPILDHRGNMLHVVMMNQDEESVCNQALL
jgi:hypothetical protein